MQVTLFKTIVPDTWEKVGDRMDMTIANTDDDIVLDFKGARKSLFVGSTDIDAPAEITYDNDIAAIEYDFSFVISGGLHKLTFPVGTMMKAGAQWNPTTREWEPLYEGAFTAHAVKDGGGNFRIDIGEVPYV